MNHLLVLALLLGNTSLWLAQVGRVGRVEWSHAWIPVGYTLAFAALAGYLAWRGQGMVREPVMVAALAGLCGIGLAAVARVDGELAARQLQWLFLGVGVFAAVSYTRVWPKILSYTYVWAVAGVALLAATILFGVEIRGAKAWLKLGPLTFQPVEFVKILFVFALATYLADAKGFLRPSAGGSLPGIQARYLGPLVLMTMLFLALLTVQRDLGPAFLLFGLTIAMISAATASLRFAAIGLCMMGAAGAAAALLFQHVSTRLAIWWNPWPTADGSGYQIVESLLAVASGGIFGTGWGRGMGERIPLVETDFIFSLIAEETGLLGASGLLFLLAVMALRAMAPALDEARDDAARLAALGLGLLFAVQTFLIVGGVTRLLPVTGITLPFVSYGGSSLLASFLQAGLAYNLLAARTERKDHGPSEGVTRWNEG